jgi:hypothetical protein
MTFDIRALRRFQPNCRAFWPKEQLRICVNTRSSIHDDIPSIQAIRPTDVGSPFRCIRRLEVVLEWIPSPIVVHGCAASRRRQGTAEKLAQTKQQRLANNRDNFSRLVYVASNKRDVSIGQLARIAQIIGVMWPASSVATMVLRTTSSA